MDFYVVANIVMSEGLEWKNHWYSSSKTVPMFGHFVMFGL